MLEARHYKFSFSSVRYSGKALQFQEIKLYDWNGSSILIESATNPQGDSPHVHPPANVIDGVIRGRRGSKWLDMGMENTGSSTLLLTLEKSGPVASYEMWTANDNPGRDPVRPQPACSPPTDSMPSVHTQHKGIFVRVVCDR